MVVGSQHIGVRFPIHRREVPEEQALVAMHIGNVLGHFVARIDHAPGEDAMRAILPAPVMDA